MDVYESLKVTVSVKKKSGRQKENDMIPMLKEAKTKNAAWEALTQRLNEICPGWSSDTRFFQQVSRTFDEEYEAVDHEGIVVTDRIHG